MNSERSARDDPASDIPDPIARTVKYARELARKDFKQGIVHDPLNYKDIWDLSNRVAVQSGLDLSYSSEQLRDEVAVQVALANIALRSQSQPEEL